MTLREFPEKSQQEIAEQVGCHQTWVTKVKSDNMISHNIPPNPHRFPGPDQADQVGCSQKHVSVVKNDNTTGCNIPPTLHLQGGARP